MFGSVSIHVRAEASPPHAKANHLEFDAGHGTAEDVARLCHVAVLLDGHPRWAGTPRAFATASSVAGAYVSEDLAFLGRLEGGFSLALIDAKRRTVHLAIDRMGIASLAWSQHANQLVFGTSPREVRERTYGDVRLDPQALYDYFFFHMVPSPTSVFQGVRKLAAACVRSFGVGGDRETMYWTPDFSHRERADFESLQRGLHEALRRAVTSAGTGSTTGAFLSGGLDSSTVSGVFASLSRVPAKTFSIGFGVESYDELSYARIASGHFGCDAREYRVTPQDVLSAIPVVARAYDEPFGNSSAIPTYCCARFAREHGIETLLAGDGGDEIFAGNERYARQRVFELFWLLPTPIRSLATGLTRGIDVDHAATVLRKFRSYVDQANVPLPERFETWNFVYREGARLMFEDAFMQSVNPTAPIRAMTETFSAVAADDLLDRMLVYDWKYTLADNDLRKVTTMCHAAGIQVRYPMLDSEVVALSLRVPSRMKMEGFKLRSFYKAAMRGFLPDAILRKKKHGFGLPFGVWLKTHAPLAEFIYSSLTDLKRRGVIKAEFIDRLVAEHRVGHPGYYGSVIWDLVILEEWMKCLPVVGVSRY